MVRKKHLPPGQKFLLICLPILCVLAIIFSIQPFYPKLNTTKPAKAATTAVSAPFTLTGEIPGLDNKLQALIKKNSKITLGIFLVIPATGQYLNINGNRTFPAASLIKIPVFIQLLQAIDKKIVSPKDVLIIRPDLIGGGSGFLQWRTPGSKITVAEAAELMMIFSDNTATNLIIDLLGGKEILNHNFVELGLAQTKINNWLPDFDGTNKTSPFELVTLFAKVDKGDILSLDAKEWMYKVMKRTHTKTLLPMGCPRGTVIIHKTGDIASLVGDAGIIDSKDLAKRYFIAIQVERKSNDRSANLFIREASKVIYDSIGGCNQLAKKE